MQGSGKKYQLLKKSGMKNGLTHIIWAIWNELYIWLTQALFRWSSCRTFHCWPNCIPAYYKQHRVQEMDFHQKWKMRLYRIKTGLRRSLVHSERSIGVKVDGCIEKWTVLGVVGRFFALKWTVRDDSTPVFFDRLFSSLKTAQFRPYRSFRFFISDRPL